MINSLALILEAPNECISLIYLPTELAHWICLFALLNAVIQQTLMGLK